jgi:DNA-binding NtrC family response regulator
MDNDPWFLRDARKLMENAGCRVIIKMYCCDVPSAFYEAMSTDFVITNDLKSGIDGQEFVAAVRKKAFSIPVILLIEHTDINT